MKAILIILAILSIMICVIMIPAFEEHEYAKTHPDFLKNAYDLRNASLGSTSNDKDTLSAKDTLNLKN